jgi:hypothetical protein
MSNNRNRGLLVSLVWFSLTFSATAADVDPLFLHDEILRVEIEAPLTTLIEERSSSEELPARFRYSDADGALVEFEIRIRARGRLRRSKETCHFPPLRLNFKKSAVRGTLFDKQDKLKLVSHCRDIRPYRQAAIAEYLTYRTFNLLTDSSFQVRLLHIVYRNVDSGDTSENYGFLIESEKRLGKRLGADTIRTERARLVEISQADMNLASVFQYFIGNTDFSPIGSIPDEECCHNQVLFVRDGALNLTVPYDFDQSGLVGAPYATPAERFHIKSVQDRVYRGRCFTNEHLPLSIEKFKKARDGIESLISGTSLLLPAKQRNMLKFIDDFYKTIENPRRLQRELVKKCI